MHSKSIFNDSFPELVVIFGAALHILQQGMLLPLLPADVSILPPVLVLVRHRADGTQKVVPRSLVVIDMENSRIGRFFKALDSDPRALLGALERSFSSAA